MGDVTIMFQLKDDYCLTASLISAEETNIDKTVKTQFEQSVWQYPQRSATIKVDQIIIKVW